MRLRRREWLTLCGLALAVAIFQRGIGAFGGGSGMRLKPGAEEHLRAQREAYQAKRRRESDRIKMLQQPEIRAAWVNHAHDRFSAAAANCELIVQTIGKSHVRGITPRSVEDKFSGDLLQVTYGDYGDNYMKGSLRVGRTGEPRPLYIRVTEEAEQSVFIVNGWGVTNTNLGSTRGNAGLQFLSEQEMNVLARLFNCREPQFRFVAMRGPPHILDRPKQRYGPHKIDLYVSDRNTFLDRYVDKHYASLGLDPSLGKLDPASIPRPWH